jgi:hypothetical protein
MIQNQLQAFERKVFAEIFGEQFRGLRSDAFVNRAPTDDMWQDALRLTGKMSTSRILAVMRYET